MDLQALADFNAVATYGGFGPAARATGTPKATLSRRVRALEAELGVRLLERGTRVMRLTDEGNALRDRTSTLLDDIANVGEEVSGASGRPRGRLRLSVPALFAQTMLGRIAADFVASYPEVLMDVVIDDRFVDPVAEGFDIVVRVNPRPDSDLVGQCFLKSDLVVAASPSIAVPNESGHSAPAVVLASASENETWRLADKNGLAIHPRPVLRCSSMLLVRDAVIAGAGAAMMPRWLVEPEIDSGRLVIWGTVADRNVEAWVLHTSRRLASPKIKAFVDALLAAYRHGGSRSSP